MSNRDKQKRGTDMDPDNPNDIFDLIPYHFALQCDFCSFHRSYSPYAVCFERHEPAAKRKGENMQLIGKPGVLAGPEQVTKPWLEGSPDLGHNTLVRGDSN